MRPKPGSNEPPLVIVKQEGMKVKDIKAILKDSTYNGFPGKRIYEKLFIYNSWLLFACFFVVRICVSILVVVCLTLNSGDPKILKTS